ncbi:MAG: hypothetical protein WC408_04160 [Candidatus Micrarchaeia archaeon]|jgi:hypothetical protein
MEQKRTAPEQHRFDLASPLFFGKSPSKLGVNFSDPELLKKIQYGPVVTDKHAAVAFDLERNLQKHAGTGAFPTHLDAYRKFIDSFDKNAPRLFFRTRLNYFEDIHDKVAAGEIRRQDVPQLLSNVAAHHLSRFNKLCSAAKKGDVEGKRKARESLFNIEYL